MESFNEQIRTYNFIIQIPIIITLVANAYIFLNVVSVVNVKLKAGQTSDYKQRLARSTLSLIPLLGIQYLGVIYLERQDWDNAGLLKNNDFILFTGIIKSTFNRVPGILVALFYCFCNNEVRTEFMSKVRGYKTKQEIELDILRRRSTISNSNPPSSHMVNMRANSTRGGGSIDGKVESVHLVNNKNSFSGSVSGVDPNSQRRHSSIFNSDRSLWLRSFFHPIARTNHRESVRYSTYGGAGNAYVNPNIRGSTEGAPIINTAASYHGAPPVRKNRHSGDSNTYKRVNSAYTGRVGSGKSSIDGGMTPILRGCVL